MVKSLEIISQQTYPDIEIIISDDCSKDETEFRILEIKDHFRYPIIYHRFPTNQGYDRNYRKSIELANGDYAMVLGNDDSLNGSDAIEKLVAYLKEFQYPDIGYCNYVEESVPDTIIKRATTSQLHGGGIDIALRHFSGFSFVAGIIYRKKTFDVYNTSKHDGSIYAQMYLGLLMIASGCSFFTIHEPLVLKDLYDSRGMTAIENYRSSLPKNWKEYRAVDGGLLSVSHVLISAVEDAIGKRDKRLSYNILRKIYMVTFPYWIVQYKMHGSLAASVGLIHGLYPPVSTNWTRIGLWGKIRLLGIYGFMSFAGLMTPTGLFRLMEGNLRRIARNQKF